MNHQVRMTILKQRKTRRETMNKYFEYLMMGVALFLLAMMIDMSIVGITPQELWADISCRF